MMNCCVLLLANEFEPSKKIETWQSAPENATCRVNGVTCEQHALTLLRILFPVTCISRCHISFQGLGFGDRSRLRPKTVEDL